jgi:hypothetical protein
MEVSALDRTQAPGKINKLENFLTKMNKKAGELAEVPVGHRTPTIWSQKSIER